MSSRFRRIRRGIAIVLFVAALAGAGAALIEADVLRAADGRTYRDVAAVPARRVAIVFGAQVLPDGHLSTALANRMDAAIALYRAGKVQQLLLTGERSTGHDEPGLMRDYALQHWLPDEAIVLDPDGLRTYDSCRRARAVFGVGAGEAILITQEYHLPRALFTCDRLGVPAIGYVAEPFQGPRAIEAEQREHPARWLAWWQVTISHPPAQVSR